MDRSSPYYITTPIYYVNDKPHIGHAYTSVACDVIARFMRLDGKKVKFLTGTDEHGQKVEKSATAAGVAPIEFVDNVSKSFEDMAKYMNISYDDFIRTTQDRHKKTAQAIWQRMLDRGHIYLDSYAGWYAVRDEAYYQESELIDGKAPTGAQVEWVEEPSYFFRLSAFEDKLLSYYNKNKDFVLPSSRFNEVKRFVEGGLRDLSISRTTFEWGVPVPGDPKHVMYVWLDALTNYLSALDYADEPDGAQMHDFWPASLHMVGKDILRFHAVYWPAFLMAAELPLPARIFAHGWWTVEGEKMSKTIGNVVSPSEMVGAFGLDQTRWFLMHEMPFGNDGNFATDALIARVNAELANNIGNLVQRTLSMVIKHCDGKVPNCNWDVFDKEMQQLCYDRHHIHIDNIHNQRLHAECEEILRISSMANEYIDRMAPWALRKSDPEKMEHVLYVLMEVIRCISFYLQPFIPNSSHKILEFLSIPLEKRSFSFLSKDFSLVPGGSINAPEVVFPRLEIRG